MELLNAIWEVICRGAEALWNVCCKIIKETINLLNDILDGIVDILSELLGGEIPGTVEDSPIKPFLGDINKLIENAPVQRVGLFGNNYNYIKGFYDTNTGEIKRPTYVGGNNVDQDLLDHMGDNPLIILG